MPEMLYSVIVPVFNSEQTLFELFRRLHSTFENIKAHYEVIFIDDGSTDESWKIIEMIKKQAPDNVKGIQLIRNFGQHNAVFCGITYASGNFYITIDDDLQQAPEDIPKLIKKYDETKSELIYGCYSEKKHNWFRNLGSKIIGKSSKNRYHIGGTGSSFRLFTQRLGKRILNHAMDFVYIDELLMWYTSDVSYVFVEHHKRATGKSGYSSTKLFRLAWNLMLYYTAFPLKVMIYGGLATAIITFLLGIFYIIKKLFFNVPPGYTSIIVAILFSTGLIIFSLGIIGEYLIRIYKSQHKKPPYAVKSELL